MGGNDVFARCKTDDEGNGAASSNSDFGNAGAGVAGFDFCNLTAAGFGMGCPDGRRRAGYGAGFIGSIRFDGTAEFTDG